MKLPLNIVVLIGMVILIDACTPYYELSANQISRPTQNSYLRYSSPVPYWHYNFYPEPRWEYTYGLYSFPYNVDVRNFNCDVVEHSLCIGKRGNHANHERHGKHEDNHDAKSHHHHLEKPEKLKTPENHGQRPVIPSTNPIRSQTNPLTPPVKEPIVIKLNPGATTNYPPAIKPKPDPERPVAIQTPPFHENTKNIGTHHNHHHGLTRSPYNLEIPSAMEHHPVHDKKLAAGIPKPHEAKSGIQPLPVPEYTPAPRISPVHENTHVTEHPPVHEKKLVMNPPTAREPSPLVESPPAHEKLRVIEPPATHEGKIATEPPRVHEHRPATEPAVLQEKPPVIEASPVREEKIVVEHKSVREPSPVIEPQPIRELPLTKPGLVHEKPTTEEHKHPHEHKGK